MSMNVQLDGEDQGLNATINTTPLVDVMLVLLIIFLITVPVINKQINVHLPDAVNIATQTKPENIVIAVKANGDTYWNNALVASSQELLKMVEAKAPGRQGCAVPVRGAGALCHSTRWHREGGVHHPA
jgi:biopolymer transport protein ExbD